jgi:hypothetical protein
MRCQTPPVPTSQLVSISLSLNAQDFSPSYLAKLFFFFPNPEVQSLTPRGGPAESGGGILVSGTGFLNTSTVRCRVGEVVSQATFLSRTLMRCMAPQIQRKEYSAEVLRLGVLGVEVLPNSWRSYPVQAYPVEVSFDGQIFSSSQVLYTYYPSPQVDSLTPASGRKDDATIVVVSVHALTNTYVCVYMYIYIYIHIYIYIYIILFSRMCSPMQASSFKPACIQMSDYFVLT